MNEEKYDYLSGLKLAHILRLRNTLVHGNYIVDEVGNKKIKYPGVRTDTIPLKLSFFSKISFFNVIYVDLSDTSIYIS